MLFIRTERVNNSNPIFAYGISARSVQTLFAIGETAANRSVRTVEGNHYLDEDVAYFTRQRALKKQVTDNLLPCYYRLLQELTEIVARISDQRSCHRR